VGGSDSEVWFDKGDVEAVEGLCSGTNGDAGPR